jgi:hypothetical protein
VTQLAHDAVMLGIPFSAEMLFSGEDPNYVTWIGVLVERVSSTKRAQHRKKGKGGRG